MIAKGSNHGCLQRGISIMRLALGYEKGLPDGWHCNRRGNFSMRDEVHAVLNAFPRHRTRIICSKGKAKALELGRTQYFSRFRANVDKFIDNHIFAVAYMHNQYGECHFFVGNPVVDMRPFTIYVLAVSIKPKRMKERI